MITLKLRRLNHKVFWGRVLPLYLLVALPVTFMVFPAQYLFQILTNWAWMFILLRIFKPYKDAT